MRIGIFTDSYRPYTSGVVKSIDTFSRELRKKGHETYIFSPNYPNSEKEENVFRFASVPAPTQKDFSLAIPLSFHISATIKRTKLELIHVHSPFLMGYLGSRCAKRHQLPLVFTYHTLYDQYTHYMPFLRNTSKQFMKNLGVDFSNKCDLVITPTNAVKKYLTDNGVTAPICNIPTGLNMSEFEHMDKEWLRECYKIPKDHVVLLFVGRLGKEKNIDFLIRCFHRVLKQLPKISLVLVGSGPEEQSLRSLSNRLGIGDRLIFTGLQEKRNVINCYAGADIFVFPSVTETQGIVLLEAKAAGLPAVAISAFGAAEMIKDGEDGFLSPHDEGTFTEYLLTLIKDQELREEMSRKAFSNINFYSAEYTTELLIEEYTNLVSGRALSYKK